MEEYLRAKKQDAEEARARHVPFLEKFYGGAWLEYNRAYYQQKLNELAPTIDDVEDGVFGLRVITSECLPTSGRYRYTLSSQNDQWKITKAEWECFSCGDSRLRAPRIDCKVCGGTGWNDPCNPPDSSAPPRLRG